MPDDKPTRPVTIRACKNALARLKLQVIFRLFFVSIGLIPLLAGIIAWRLWLILIGLLILDIPSILLTCMPDLFMGILNTERAHASIGYEGFFPTRKIDLFFTPPFDTKKKIGVIAALVFIGWFWNLRALVRIVADYLDVEHAVPKKKGGGFPAVWKRFCQGLGMLLVLFLIWCSIAGVIANAIADKAGSASHDPYRFKNAIEEDAENTVIDTLSQTLREENYLYYVNIPFNENGFLAQGVSSGWQSASYLAAITHQTSTQECWEIVLTLNEQRSAAWKDTSKIVHPIHFDSVAASETIYVSGSDEKTIYYRDASGTYTSVPESEAPESYRALLRYILLDAQTIDAMQQDDEHTQADAETGFIHIRYETDALRITVGVKDDRYPYEAAVSYLGDNALSFETEAIRFDAMHVFTLPQAAS